MQLGYGAFKSTWLKRPKNCGLSFNACDENHAIVIRLWKQTELDNSGAIHIELRVGQAHRDAVQPDPMSTQQTG